MKTSRWMAGIAAVGALALLALLYDRSQSADPAARASVQDDLRQAHQLDSDWNVAVMSAKVGLGDSYDALVEPLRAIRDLLRRIDRTQAAQGAPVRTELDALGHAYSRKADLVDHFKSHNSILRNSMRYLPSAAGEARDELLATRDAQAVRIAAGIGVCVEEAARYAVIPEAGQQQRLAASIQDVEDQLREWPGGGAPRAAAVNFLTHARTVLRQVEGEGALLAGILQVPTVAGIENVAVAYDGFFGARASRAELWRQALVAYSAALLLVVGYTGWRLRQSYRQIRAMNGALVEANDHLEHRVQERTRELADALTSLHESEAQLVQSEKMSSLGQMVAGVAHEINTPLAYVRSSLETVRDQLDDVEDLVNHAVARDYDSLAELAGAFHEHGIVREMRELAGQGVHGLDQIGEIVTNLKNFSRLDRSKTTKFDLREGLESTLSIARGSIKTHRIVKRYASIPLVECSPSQLNQVFLNLVTNAAQAITHDRGVIVVSTTALESGMVRVDVQDNGSGIPPDVMGRIFDPFFTTKAIGQGTGLGLSIAYKIVQEHGGRIDVTSVPGEGTTFSVRLPACKEAEIEIDTLVEVAA